MQLENETDPKGDVIIGENKTVPHSVIPLIFIFCFNKAYFDPFNQNINVSNVSAD